MLGISSLLSAQAPGLAGKQLSIFYNYTSAFKTEDIRYNNAIDRGKNFSSYIAGEHSLQFNYAISRIREIGISTSYFRDGYGTFYSYSLPIFSRNISVMSYGLHVKKFRIIKGSIAPLGAYREVAFHFLNVNASLAENPDYFDDPQVYKQDRGTKMASMTFGLGRSVVLFGDAIIAFGYEVGFVIPLDLDVEPFDNFLLSDRYGTPLQRMNRFYRGRLKMSIGLAAY